MKRMKKLEIERGDFLFFFPSRWYQKVIAYFDGKYSHCGIALSSSQYLSMTTRGLEIQEIPKNRKIDVFVIDKEYLYDDDLYPTSLLSSDTIIDFLLEQMPVLRYDFSGILSFIFRFIFHNPRRFYCSEVLTWALYYLGLVPERLQLSPLQLANQEFFRYKGTIILKDEKKDKK